MISVCMATYNGEKYIKTQLESILVQLDKSDEVIIIDDLSVDKTIKIIRDLKDDRIRLIRNKINRGPIASFEKAIRLSKGDYIFLADQDDCWKKNKVTLVIDKFKKEKAILVVHDCLVTDESLKVTSNSWNEYNHNHFTNSWMKSILKNPFTGANMAFKSELVSKILPFPTNIPMHDWWIGAVCLKNHYKICILSDKLSFYRRHGDNVTGYSHNLKKMIVNRVNMLLLMWGK